MKINTDDYSFDQLRKALINKNLKIIKQNRKVAEGKMLGIGDDGILYLSKGQKIKITKDIEIAFQGGKGGTVRNLEM